MSNDNNKLMEELQMSETENNLMKQFIQFNRMLHHYQIHNLRGAGPLGNPYRGQGRVLAILKMKPEITQKELAYLLDMRNQSLGELLAKLEKNEYITREPSEEDRRVMNVKLTEAGAEAVEQSKDNQTDYNKIFDVLDDEEKANLHDYLHRITDELGKALGDMSEDEGFDDPRLQGRGGFPGFGGGRPRGGGHGPGHRGHHCDPRFSHGRYPDFGAMRNVDYFGHEDHR